MVDDMKFKINEALILSLASNRDVYLRGERMYDDNKVLEIAGFVNEENNEVILAKVDGAYKNYTITLTFSKDGEFKRYSCDCDGNKVWKGTCKHVVAVMIALINKSPKIDLNKKASANIIKYFENSIYSVIEKEMSANEGANYTVELFPYLIVNNIGNAELRLKIGEDTLYNVKNIKALLKDIDAGAVSSYGKGFNFKHNINAFKERAQKLINILNDYKDAFYDTFIMPPRFFDKFFDIYCGSVVQINNEIAMLTEDKPEIKFYTELKDNKVKLCTKRISYSVISGEKFLYFFINNKLYKIEVSKGRSVLMLLNEFGSSQTEEIIFENDNYSKFISYVLPLLNKMDMIDENSIMEHSLHVAPLVSKLYFDATPKKITCKVNFVYEGKEINPILGTNDNILRDTYEEMKILSRLKGYGFEKTVNGEYVLANENQMFDFHESGLKSLNKISEVYLSEEFSKNAIKQVKKPSYGVRLKGNLLHISIEDLDYSISELIGVMDAYKLKKKYFRLKDGSFINLGDENLSEYAKLLDALNLSKKDVSDEIKLPAYRAMYVKEVLSENENVAYDQMFEELIENVEKFNNNKIKCPKQLSKTLRAYQKTGFKWLKMLTHYGFSGILADDMGLGKTLQVICLLLSEKGQNKGASIVVTPTSLMYNWAHEIEKFAPMLKTAIITGSPQKRTEIFTQSKDTDVFITTYDMLKRDIDNYENTEFNFVIADEAQYIKNPSTQNAIAIKTLNSRSRFALTGTPIENSLSELWSIFDFILPGYLYSADKFTKIYENPIVKQDDKEKAVMLQKQIGPFILRRMKKDVLKELPDKVETMLYAEMEEEQRKIYAAYLLQARGELEGELLSDFNKNKVKILSMLTRLRQICCHPAMFIDNYAGGSGKLSLALETILSAVESGHRLLIFSQFTSMLNILMKTLDDNKISYYYLDGATKSMLRTNMVDKFNAGEKDVFLISLKAGGTGLNLTSADIVLHFDQWWNPAVMNQATDRAHRIGQRNVVQVIHVITKDTIEEKMIKLQEKKKALFDSVLLQDSSFLNKMTADEIRELFL